MIISLYAKETCCIDGIRLVLEKCAFLSVSYHFSTFVGFGTFHKNTERSVNVSSLKHYIFYHSCLFCNNGKPIILCNAAIKNTQRCNSFKSFLESERSDKIANVRYYYIRQQVSVILFKFRVIENLNIIHLLTVTTFLYVVSESCNFFCYSKSRNYSSAAVFVCFVNSVTILLHLIFLYVSSFISRILFIRFQRWERQKSSKQ